MKKAIEQLVNKAVLKCFGEDFASAGFVISNPPKLAMGDYATNVAMVLAKKLDKDPKVIAEQLAKEINEYKLDIISRIEVLGGFVNFYVSPKVWFKEVLEEVEKLGEIYGTSKQKNPENVMVEYFSPNTNKPLHLGHVRNGIIGTAVINLLQAQGHKVIKAGIINDRGVHICKAMLAYQLWGDGSTPELAHKKPDHFVGDWYVRFAQESKNNPQLNEQAQDMLRRWEAGEAEVHILWKKIRGWVLEGWEETNSILGFVYDKGYFESEVYQQGKSVVEDGVSRGVFRKNENGNIIFDLSVDEFGTDEEGKPRMITLLRQDGTSLYTTQDLGLAVTRADEFNLDRLVFVVGSEQRFHFQSLFAILKALGYSWAQKLYHLWYGMVYLPDGKMKSREGTVVDADDLIAQMVGLAEKEIEARDGETDKAGIRARQVAMAAIKFFMLRTKPTTDIHFNPKESLSFEGFTGPYCQYAYARARNILRTAESRILNPQSLIDYSALGEEDERTLIRQLEGYPEAVQLAGNNYDPGHLANYVFQTARIFNQFYSSSPVLKADDNVANARLALVKSTAQVLKNGLVILGIEAPERM